jgi:hypothetical protein
MSAETDTGQPPAVKCRICGSEEHQAGAGPICPDGYRLDYVPGRHDPWTGEERPQA